MAEEPPNSEPRRGGEDTTPPRDDPNVGSARAQSGSAGAMPTAPMPSAAAFAPTDPGERPGQRFGRYTLLERIGEGGFGEVWKARRDDPEGLVAIKILKSSSGNREVLARFGQERNAMALLDHPNIAKSVDAGLTDRGRPYFVMEYVPGEPITDYCDRKRSTISQRIELFTQVCEAVGHVHTRGLVHRDLKPSNILVMDVRSDDDTEPRPLAKIIDFGVAKSIGRRIVDATIDTQPGRVLGTLAYMAPEQAGSDDRDIDHRADIFALGVVLFELLAGELPISRETLESTAVNAVFDLLRRTVRKPASAAVEALGGRAEPVAEARGESASSLRRRLRSELEWIPARALFLEPKRRYATAQQMGDDLRRYLEQEPLDRGTRPPSRLYVLRKTVQRYRWAVAGATLVFMLLTVALIVVNHFRVRAAEAEEARGLETTRANQQAIIAEQQGAIAGERASEAMAARDREREAREAEAEAAAEALRQADAAAREAYAANVLAAAQLIEEGQIEVARARLLACRRDLRGWEWGFLARSLYWPIAELGGPEARILSVAWSPDGSRLAAPSADRVLRIWDVDGSREPVSLGTGDRLVFGASWSPDGTRLVTTSLGSPTVRGIGLRLERTASVWMADGSGTPIVLRGHEGRVTSAAWSPDSSRIVTASEDGTARVWSAEGTLVAEVLAGHEGAVSFAAWSPDGSRILTASDDGSARVWDAAGSRGPVVLRGHEGGVAVAGWSPDGSRIVTASADGTTRLWNPNGSGMPTVLEGHEGAVSAAVWSPDGSRILTASADGTARVWDATGSRVQSVIRDLGTGVSSAAWSPDGSRIIVSCADGTARVCDADGSRVPVPLRADTRPLEGFTSSAAWSPDGAHIVTASPSGAAQLWRAGEIGGPLALRGHGPAPFATSWSPDGNRVLTLSDGLVRVWSAEGVSDPVWPQGRGQRALTAGWTPDGTQIVTTSTDHGTRSWNADGLGEPRALGAHGRAGDFIAAWSPDYTRVFLASIDNTASFVDADGTATPARLPHPALQYNRAVWSPDGTRLLLTGVASAALLSPEGSMEPATLALKGLVFSVAWSPDSTRVALVGMAASNPLGGAVVVWNADGLGVPIVLEGHQGLILRADWSPDGRRIVTASNDRTAMVWDADGAGAPLELRGHEREVTSAAWSPDGTRIVTASKDNTVRVWSVEGSREPLVIHGRGHAVHSADWSPDGTRIITTSSDGTARIWDSAPVAYRRRQKLVAEGVITTSDLERSVAQGRLERWEIEPLPWAVSSRGPTVPKKDRTLLPMPVLAAPRATNFLGDERLPEAHAQEAIP